jgi:hypothetical protein
VGRHGEVASSPEILKQYERWRIEQAVINAEFASIKAEGEAKGRAEGEAKTFMTISLNTFKDAMSDDDFSHACETLRKLGVPEDIIKTARETVEAERDWKR